MEVTLDTAEAEELLRKQARWLSSQELAKAGAAALNRAGRAAQTQGSREVRKRLAMKARDVKARMKATRATPGRQRYKIDFDYSPVPLAEYGRPRQTRRGVGVTIRRGKRVTMANTFISEKLGGQVLIRTMDTATGRRVGRGPVRRAYGPSIGSQLEAAKPAMDKRAEEVLDDRLRHEIRWRVERANR